ncbi:hypothetical protein TWF694_002920 [Orbilia ellipsospora]|uniref:Uncharacterized protein n=1 Tax=Orbilia ellipsospora TaxID=2528407 RepID=A0AAV9X036_9PEZI
MHSKAIITSLFLAVAPYAFAAPYYQPVITTACSEDISVLPTITSTFGPTYVIQTAFSTPNNHAEEPTTICGITTSIEAPIQTSTTEYSTFGGYVDGTVTSLVPPLPTITTQVTASPNPPPATVTVIQFPPGRPHRTKHCTQEWYCNGKCPADWTVVRYQGLGSGALACDVSTPEKIIDACSITTGFKCLFSLQKVLCEKCKMTWSEPRM